MTGELQEENGNCFNKLQSSAELMVSVSHVNIISRLLVESSFSTRFTLYV